VIRPIKSVLLDSFHQPIAYLHKSIRRRHHLLSHCLSCGKLLLYFSLLFELQELQVQLLVRLFLSCLNRLWIYCFETEWGFHWGRKNTWLVDLLGRFVRGLQLYWQLILRWISKTWISWGSQVSECVSHGRCQAWLGVQCFSVQLLHRHFVMR